MAKLEANAVCGEWMTEGKHGKAKVTIEERDGKFYGAISWMENPNDESGGPRKDVNNPDPAKREQAYVGMEVMGGFEFDGKYKWEGGKAYDPDNGKSYKGNIKMPNIDKLKLRGYVGVSALGRTETWRRAKD